MQPRGFMRAVLAITLGLGVPAGLLRADEARPLPNPTPASAPVLEHSLAPAEPFYSSQDAVLPEWRSVSPRPAQPSAPREHVRNCVTKYLAANLPIFCWADINSVGCGNFCSEFHFIFGSCRTFYGETCFKGPPPQPVPAGYWYSEGYTYGSGERKGCRCP